MKNSFQTASGERPRAIALLLLALLFWGLSFPLIKAMMLLNQRLVPGAGGAFVAACILGPRFLIALPLLLLWERLFGAGGERGRPWTRREIRQGCWIGFFAAGGMLLQTDGLRYTAASTSAFLTQFYAVMIPLWVALRGRRRPGIRVIAGGLMVLAGVAILSRFDWRTARFGRGEWETLLSSLFFMGQILSVEHDAFTGNHAGRTTVVMFVILGLAFSAVAVVSAPGAAATLALWRSGPWIALSALLAGFCTLGGFLIMNTWQPKISATEAGLLYTIEPIFGSIFALFLPGLLASWTGIAYADEKATVNLLAGGGLITLANVLVHLRPASSEKMPPHGPQP